MTEIIERVERIFKGAKGDGSPEQVAQFHQKGIDAMMLGDTQEALEYYFAALEAAGTDPNSQASSIYDIADFTRIIPPVDLELALKLFDRGDSLVTGFIEKVRGKIMRAGVYFAPTEAGENDPEGISEAMLILFEAFELSRQAAQKGLEGAFDALIYALKRLSGIGVLYGSPQEKAWIKEEIELILPKMDPDDKAVANFLYKLAILKIEKIFIPSGFKEPAWMFFGSAVSFGAWSPINACELYAWAAICFHRAEMGIWAQLCLKRAKSLEHNLDKHANSGTAKAKIADAAALIGPV